MLGVMWIGSRTNDEIMFKGAMNIHTHSCRVLLDPQQLYVNHTNNQGFTNNCSSDKNIIKVSMLYRNIEVALLLHSFNTFVSFTPISVIFCIIIT